MKIKELFEDIVDQGAINKFLLSNKNIWEMNDGVLFFKHRDFNLDTYRGILVKNGELIVPLGNLIGNLDGYDCGLRSFKNFPEHINGFCYLGSNPFKSIDGIPKHMVSLDLSNCNNIKSFEGIGSLIKSCEHIMIPETLERNMLGLLKIPNLESIDLEVEEASEELLKATRIINNHLAHDRNIIACQKELYDNDLDEYAEL